MRPCHNRDRTYPYPAHPDLSTSFPSHQNHSRAPLPIPNPLIPHPILLASHQRIPNPLASSRANLRLINALLNPLTPWRLVNAFPTTIPIPDPTPLCPSSFSCVKSIPDDPSVSRPRSGEARSRTSLARSVLVCPFSPSIYLSSLLSAVRFLCLIVRYPSLVSLSHTH